MCNDEIAKAAGSYGYLCECNGHNVFAHHPVGRVVERITREEHQAQFSAEDYD